MLRWRYRGYEGIFAGGDMVPAERTVTVGVGHGKQAARNIDAWLRGSEFTHPPAGELADFPTLNTWYYADALPIVAPRLDIIRRQSTFDEVTQGLDETNALFEARRCLSCGEGVLVGGPGPMRGLVGVGCLSVRIRRV